MKADKENVIRVDITENDEIVVHSRDQDIVVEVK